MKNLPFAVHETFVRLKKEHQFPLTVDVFNGRYYLYKRETRWDKGSKRVLSTAEYLGKIREDGTFIPKKHTREKKAARVPTPPTALKIDHIDEKILTHLSMNCRSTLKTIAGRTGLSANAVEHRIAGLEKKFAIRYFCSINYLKLGLSPYVILIKFKDARPDTKTVKEVLEKEPRIQLAMATHGKYDFLVYLLAENSTILSDVVFNIRKNARINKFSSIWRVIAFDEIYGYVPFRERFFEILEEKIWQRSKKTPSPFHGSLKYREYALLKAMSIDGNMPFAEVEKEYGLGHGAAKYTLEKLKENGLIWRQTLTLRNQNVKYDAIISIRIINYAKFLHDRAKLLDHIIKDSESPINRFALAGNTVSPDGIMLIMPVFKDGELEAELEWLNSQIRGVTLEASIGTDFVLGELCYRRFDNSYSQQFKILAEEYGLKRATPITY